MTPTPQTKIITQAEALERGIANAKFVNEGHQAYLNDQKAASDALELLRQARLAIFDSYFVRMKARPSGSPPTITDRNWYALVKNEFLDSLKIGAGVELCLKAKLIHQGYVVHLLERRRNEANLSALLARQRKQPIRVDELPHGAKLFFDVDHPNCAFVRDLSVETIKLSTLLEPGYRECLQLEDRHYLLASIFRERRNMIHLPTGDYANRLAHFLSGLNESDLFGFVERHIHEYAPNVAKTITDDNVRRHALNAVTENLDAPG